MSLRVDKPQHSNCTGILSKLSKEHVATAVTLAVSIGLAAVYNDYRPAKKILRAIIPYLPTSDLGIATVYAITFATTFFAGKGMSEKIGDLIIACRSKNTPHSSEIPPQPPLNRSAVQGIHSAPAELVESTPMQMPEPPTERAEKPPLSTVAVLGEVTHIHVPVQDPVVIKITEPERSIEQVLPFAIGSALPPQSSFLPAIPFPSIQSANANSSMSLEPTKAMSPQPEPIAISQPPSPSISSASPADSPLSPLPSNPTEVLPIISLTLPPDEPKTPPLMPQSSSSSPATSSQATPEQFSRSIVEEEKVPMPFAISPALSKATPLNSHMLSLTRVDHQRSLSASPLTNQPLLPGSFHSEKHSRTFSSVSEGNGSSVTPLRLAFRKPLQPVDLLKREIKENKNKGCHTEQFTNRGEKSSNFFEGDKPLYSYNYAKNSPIQMFTTYVSHTIHQNCQVFALTDQPITETPSFEWESAMDIFSAHLKEIQDEEPNPSELIRDLLKKISDKYSAIFVIKIGEYLWVGEKGKTFKAMLSVPNYLYDINNENQEKYNFYHLRGPHLYRKLILTTNTLSLNGKNLKFAKQHCSDEKLSSIAQTFAMLGSNGQALEAVLVADLSSTKATLRASLYPKEISKVSKGSKETKEDAPK